jgi:hypothetical protein
MKNIKYENIFYMTEINNSPFIKDEEFLLKHDLVDIPGLSEFQEHITIPTENEIKDNEGEDAPKPVGEEEKMNIVREKLGLLQEKEKELKNIEIKEEDEIFYMEKNIIKENTYISEIFSLIKTYIDGLIIILNVENYFYEANYDLITKLHKVIRRPIKNCLVLLNKID